MSNLEISRAERLDLYVVRQIPELSRGAANKLIERGDVYINGEPQTKAGYKVRLSDTISIDYSPDLAFVVPEIDLEIIYEDDDCVVIHKPLGVLTHSKGAFNPEPTVATWLHAHVAKIAAKKDKPHLLGDNPSDRAGIVHRLDRATSGVMICAKTPDAHAWLQKQFSQRRVKKTYQAIVSGSLEPKEAIIDMPIERNPKKPQTFRVGVNGKAATTTYRVEKENATMSLVRLQPKTGRTHQLRVHMQHLGHPIFGDTLYGGKPADRLYLHAQELELTLPNRERRTFSVPVPESFEELLA
jgi:23S rRNA pseudouridine1911/1915/1917 synthase